MNDLPFTRTQLELMDHVFCQASMGKKLGLSAEQREQCTRIAMVFEAYASQKRIDQNAKAKEKAAQRKGGEKFVNSPKAGKVTKTARSTVASNAAKVPKTRNKSLAKQGKHRKSK